MDEIQQAKQLMRGFVTAVMLDKPADIVSYGAQYFRGYPEAPAGCDLRPLVIAGASGVGKSTIVSEIMRLFPDRLAFVVSHTTRQPRPGEAHGVHYHFVSAETMSRLIERGMFVEHAEVHGNRYGTSKDALAAVTATGRIPILDVDVQGVKQLKSALESMHTIFITPPSMQQLEERLRGRGGDDDAAIQTRLANAKEEIAYGTEAGNFELVVENGVLDDTVATIANQLRAWYPHLQN